MNEPTISFVGNLTAAPQLKFLPTGRAVANVAVVCNPRRYDSTTSQWVDGAPVFWPCEVWGTLGEHAADSLRKGDRVVVTGRVKAYAWTPSEGPNAGVEQRRLQVVVDELGASLRFATVKVVKADRGTDPTGYETATETSPSDDPPF